MTTKKIILTDLILGLSLIVLSLIGIKFFNYINDNNYDNKLIAVIEQNNQVIKQIDLRNVTQAYYIDIGSQYPTKILVEPGKISFYESTCPDKICEHYGKLSRKGQFATCLPARVIIRIIGKNQNIDSITG